MIKDDVLRLWQQRPFQPFRIITVVGEAIDVWNHRLMIVSGNTIAIGQPHPNKPPPAAIKGTWLGFDDVARVELLNIRQPLQYRIPTPDEIPF
jgi:hypothetical protein